MTPHNIVENWYNKCFPHILKQPKMVKIIDHMINARHFDFTDCVPNQEHLDFAQKLHENKKLHLFWPVMFITSSRLREKKTCILAIEKENEFDIIRISKSVKEGLPKIFIPILIAHMNKDRSDEDTKWEFIIEEKDEKIIDEDERKECEKGVSAILGMCFGLIAMSKSKEAESKEIDAPEKLNKIREARGKIKINTRVIITLSKDYKKAFSSGNHKSPDTHWRRGHHMKLPSGDITWRRGCIVNENDKLPQTKNYVVKA